MMLPSAPPLPATPLLVAAPVPAATPLPVAVPVPATPLPEAVPLPVSVPLPAAAATSAAPATTGATPLLVAAPVPAATLPAAVATSAAPATTGGGGISKRSVKAKDSGAPLPFSKEEELLSLVLPIIFRVGPAVNNHNVATPVLAMIVFASHMAWLVGPVAGGTTLYLNAVLETKFSKALPGWKWLCRVFGLCERGLFLNSRNKFEAQFLGQPASLMKDTVNLFLNSTRAPNQWVSRRVTLRPYLDLWTVDDTTPGHVTAVELASLRQTLEDVEGLAMAQAAGCTVVDKVTADGEVIKLGRLVFNWGVSWQPDCSPAAQW